MAVIFRIIVMLDLNLLLCLIVSLKKVKRRFFAPGFNLVRDSNIPILQN